MTLQRSKIPCWSYADYKFLQGKEQTDQDPLILLLHGFGERAQRIDKVLGPYLPQHLDRLVPNAPFPLPKKITTETEAYYKIGFAWYFYDDLKEEFYIDYSYPAQWLMGLLKELKMSARPVLVIGYSQGGYLAPFVAEQLPHCLGVVGINCRFRDDLLNQSPPAYPLLAIHARNDSKVDPVRAHESFQKLLDRGYPGQFHFIEDEDHELTPASLKEIQDQISQTFSI